MSNSFPTPMKQSQLETGNIQFQELVGALYNTTSVLNRINTVEKLKYFFFIKIVIFFQNSGKCLSNFGCNHIAFNAIENIANINKNFLQFSPLLLLVMRDVKLACIHLLSMILCVRDNLSF